MKEGRGVPEMRTRVFKEHDPDYVPTPPLTPPEPPVEPKEALEVAPPPVEEPAPAENTPTPPEEKLEKIKSSKKSELGRTEKKRNARASKTKK